RSEIAPRRRRHVGARQPLAQRDLVAERVLQARPALRDQVVAEILAAALAVAGQIQRLAGHVDLRAPRAASQILDRAAIAVTGGEVHRAELGLGAEEAVAQAGLLAPVP